MEKEIKEFLHMGKHKEKREKEFFLDDVLERDPTRYCPNCSSKQILLLHTHSVDSYDYLCSKCDFTYTIWLFESQEV